MKEYRKVTKLDNGIWVQIPFRNLKIGDKFRLFENDNEPVNDGEIFEAISLPYIYSLEGIYEIQVKGEKYEKSGN